MRAHTFLVFLPLFLQIPTRTVATTTAMTMAVPTTTRAVDTRRTRLLRVATVETLAEAAARDRVFVDRTVCKPQPEL
jgi:hypothetical protein